MTESSAPEFGGKCAFAMSVGGTAKAPNGNPKYSLAKDGKTYFFSGAAPKLLFQIIPGSAARAEAHWGAK
jgi:YHS domain-containing protein